MAQVPASSRGLSASGGTITGALLVDGSATPGTTAQVNGQVNGNGDLFDVYAGGLAAALQIFQTAGAPAGLYAVSNVSGQPALYLDGASSGSANLLSVGKQGPVLAGVNSSGAVFSTVGAKTNPLTSGALPTVAPVTTTPFQCSTTRDVTLLQIVTYNPSAGAAATCKVELSPDNVTYSTLITISYPPGVVFDGTVLPLTLAVPAAWYVKLTTTNATLGAGTYY